MLIYTFQHITGFGEVREKEFYNRNIFTWDDYDEKYTSQLSLGFVESIFEESRLKLKNKDADFFSKKLPSNLQYRIPHTFPDETLFLDIETTGLSRYYDKITIIGWSFKNTYKVFINGFDNNRKELYNDFKKAKCIITFNGAIFDLPFIKATFSDLKIPACHIDLRFFGKRLGFDGGQKSIEKKLEIKRPETLIEIDGAEATVLWYKYKEGDKKSLKKLIQYNESDINGMKVLFEQFSRLVIKESNAPISQKKVIPFSKYKSKSAFTLEEKEKGKIFIPQYIGKVGPQIFLRDLTDVSEETIVGIDLTGSEKKATGWCLLKNNSAITRPIYLDEELIEETIKLKPAIISIDSPLSLPFGRISVYDSDPGRNVFGITRECERIMAKRGVKSYPCLIQSMQKLTERGMRLADRFRKLGFPVIESYPGAAQDILGIPRKRRSMEYLIKGLQRFGINGDYDKPGITHDEIDAITSALVGYFFLANQFEALGNENEDYLIIPELNKSVNAVNRIVIGLSGLISSGKTTSGRIFESLGFAYGRYSLVLNRHLEEQGKDITRSNLQEFGDFVNKHKGQRWLGIELLKLLPIDKNLVIDGLRFPEDHAFLKETFGKNFYHIHLQAKLDNRKQRYYEKPENDKPFEDANAHSVENDVTKLSNFADIVLPNDGLLSELEENLKKIAVKLCQYQS